MTTRVVVFWPVDFSDHFEAKKRWHCRWFRKNIAKTPPFETDEFVTFFQKKMVVYSRMNCLLSCFQMSKTINTMSICTVDFKNAPIQQHASSKKQFWSGWKKNLWKWKNTSQLSVQLILSWANLFLQGKSGQTQPFKAKATFHFHSVSRSLSRQHCQDARQWKTTQRPPTKQE